MMRSKTRARSVLGLRTSRASRSNFFFASPLLPQLVVCSLPHDACCVAAAFMSRWADDRYAVRGTPRATRAFFRLFFSAFFCFSVFYFVFIFILFFVWRGGAVRCVRALFASSVAIQSFIYQASGIDHEHDFCFVAFFFSCFFCF